MTMLGRRRASTTRELLYTSLLPSAGPTRLCYDLDSRSEQRGPLLPYRSDHATNIIWTDLDGAPLTVHRKSSHLGYDFGDLNMGRRQSTTDYGDFNDQDLPPRRERRHVTGNYEGGDYDMGNFFYRRPSKEERDDFGEHYTAVVPFQPVIVEEEEQPVSALCRSDTVANLLTKYSNFSVRREFGYHKPESAWTRHFGKTNDFLSTLPDYEEEEPLARGDVHDMALVPANKSLTPKLYDDDVTSRRNVNSRDRSRSHTPRGVSVGKENSMFAKDDDSIMDRSRARENSYSYNDAKHFERSYSSREPIGREPYSSREPIGRESYSSREPIGRESYSSRELIGRESAFGREDSSITSSRKRFSNIYEEEEDSFLAPPKQREDNGPDPLSVDVDVPDYLMQTPEQMGPQGRPGGALQRYRERKAREALGVFEHPDYSSYYNDENEILPSSKKNLSQSQPPSRREALEESQNSTISSQQRQETSSRKSKESHSRIKEESQNRSVQESRYDERQETYSRSSKSQYARESRDTYSPPPNEKKRGHCPDPYHRQASDSFRQPPPSDRRREDAYERMAPEPYDHMPQDPYSRPSHDSYNGRPAYEPYGRRAMDEPYGAPPPKPHRQSRDTEEDFSRRPSRSQQGRRGTMLDEEDNMQYGGGYTRNRQTHDRSIEEYGNGYGSSSSYGYGSVSNGGEYTSARRERVVSKIVPFIDEDDRSGRSLTPREEERRAVGKLASKYLKPRAFRDQYLGDN